MLNNFHVFFFSIFQVMFIVSQTLWSKIQKYILLWSRVHAITDKLCKYPMTALVAYQYPMRARVTYQCLKATCIKLT